MDRELNIAQGALEALVGDLQYLNEISSPSEFVLEYSAILSESASFILQAYNALTKITDPSVLNSPYYKAVLSDLTKKTSPSLVDAAREVSSNPYALANVLIDLKGTTGFTLSQFEGDINGFDRLLNFSNLI